jgi:WD40 repeat protein
LTLWNVRTLGRIGAVIRTGVGRINAVAFSPDGQTVASGNSYGEVALWRLEDGEKLWQHTSSSGIRSLRWTPDGASVIAVGNTLDRLAADTGKPVGSAIAPGVGESSALAVSRDGTQAVVGGFTGKVAIVDIASVEVRYIFPGHAGRVYGIAFVDEGRTVISASEDGSMIAREIDPDGWESRACAAAGRPLTADEAREYGIVNVDVCPR